MGIDHPDEDDAPGAARDTPGDGRDRWADSEAELGADVATEADRIAYSLKYRAEVDAVRQAAWDEAAPSFRRAWEEHEARYPDAERSRPTVHDDGSWRGDGDRELSPAQNADVDRGSELIREVGEKAIIPGMRRIEAEDSGRHLVGFEHRFKEADRLKEKAADQLRSTPGLTPAQALAVIPDAVRFTLQYPHESYVSGVRKDIERLEANGYVQVERRNTWTSEQYKGINSRWREPESGVLFEVQFHTRISFEAKELTHKAYERIRGTAEEPELSSLRENFSAGCVP